MKNNKDKYILIFSSDFDQSTSDVIEWILNKECFFHRFNDKIGVNIKHITIGKQSNVVNFTFNNKEFSTKDIRSFWYRRGVLTQVSENIIGDSSLSFFLGEENNAKVWFLTNELDKKSKINHIKTSDLNKLFQLTLATKCGIKIPSTIVTTNKKELSDFVKSKKLVIAKSVQSTFFAINKSTEYGLLTNIFDNKDLAKTTAIFFSTTFQEQVVKKYELRIFYLDGIFFSMAIFSQNNPKTVVDFRNYDSSSPNRTVPFQLPINIERKLNKLMIKLELKSGSIDMIVNEKDEYIFLEVNPIGQFGMVSNPCNYYIEEMIAKKLYDG